MPPPPPPLRDRCARIADVDPATLEQFLIAHYPPGATIGWHRDPPMCGAPVAGVSLLSPCTMRLRRRAGEGTAPLDHDADSACRETTGTSFAAGPMRNGRARRCDSAEGLRLMLWNALILVVMAISLALYFRGLSHIRAARWEAPAFVLGWVTVAVALGSPVDALHMTRQELLMIVAAPLLVVGRPVATVLWGLPLRTRDIAANVIRRRVLLTIWRRMTGPFTVLALHAIVLLTARHPMVFVTAALFWWALIHGRYGRVGYGLALLFVVATMMHTSISARPLEDQQLAGLVLWIPAGVIVMTLALALFAAWIGESERPRSRPHL